MIHIFTLRFLRFKKFSFMSLHAQ